MSKYSFDFKKKVVMEYLNGEGGSDALRPRKKGRKKTLLLIQVLSM